MTLASPRRQSVPAPAPDAAAEQLVRRIAEVADARKALNIVVLDVRGRSSYASFLLIASGTSDRHAQAVAEGIDTEMRQEAHRPLGSEGMREGQWVLLDFGSVVVHVFHPYTRDIYDLEGLWRDAPRLALPAPTTINA